MFFDKLPLGTPLSADMELPADLEETARNATEHTSDSAVRASGYYDLGVLVSLQTPSRDGLAHFGKARDLAREVGDQDLTARASRMIVEIYFNLFLEEIRHRAGFQEREAWLTELERLSREAESHVPTDSAGAELALHWTVARQEIKLLVQFLGIHDRDSIRHLHTSTKKRSSRVLTLFAQIDPETTPALAERTLETIEMNGATIAFLEQILCSASTAF